jgi:hypothetical protein
VATARTKKKRNRFFIDRILQDGFPDNPGKALAQQAGDGSVAFEAERAHVGEVAFTAAFGDRDDVIGIPEGAAEAILEIPFAKEFVASLVVELEEVEAEGDGVEAATGTDAFVALEDFIAEIARVGAEFPIVNAGFGTESPAAFGDGLRTAAAEGASVGAFGDLRGVEATSGLGALTGVEH